MQWLGCAHNQQNKMSPQVTKKLKRVKYQNSLNPQKLQKFVLSYWFLTFLINFILLNLCIIHILHIQPFNHPLPLQTITNRRVLAVVIRNTRSGPKPLIESFLQIIGYERRSTERTRLLIVIHPTVQTAPVKYVPAIRLPSDLIAAVEFVQAHRTALRRVNQVREFHNG